MKIKRFICETCTYEWEVPQDETLCPFCNSSEISPYHPIVKYRCDACAYVWSELKSVPGCPVCGSTMIQDYVRPNKMRCNTCSYRWTTRELYPVCTQCGSDDTCLDYTFDKTFELILEEPGEKRRQIIYTLADLCTTNIGKAADMLDQCPISVMDNLNEKDAIQLKMQFEDMGAKVALKVS